MRRLIADAAGWLRSEVVDVVAVLPGSPALPDVGEAENAGHGTSQLDEALGAWGRRLRRKRLCVIAPRALALALILGALIAVVFAVSGSRLNLAVAVCLSVPPLVALAMVGASAWRDPSQREVARVFDRDLALDERIGTAVEISAAGLAVDGLAALVLAEANAALAAGHLSGARPVHRSVRSEWLACAGALLIISSLLVLIAGRDGSLGAGPMAARTLAMRPAVPSALAKAGGAKYAQSLITGRTGRGGRRPTTPSLRSAGRNSALSVVTQPQTSAAGGRPRPAGSNQRTSPGAFGRSQSRSPNLGAKAGTRGAESGARGAGRGEGNGSSVNSSTHSAGLSHRGSPGSSRGAGGRGHTTKLQRVGSGSRLGTFNPNSTPSSHGLAKAPASGSSPTHATGNANTPSAHSAGKTGQSPSSHGRSVGNSAGAGAGGNPVGRRQTNRLPSGFARLRVQAGSTSVRNKSGSKIGSPGGRSGGNGRARSSTQDDGGSATAMRLPYIPPSADTGPADGALLRHYFSTAPTVTGHW